MLNAGRLDRKIIIERNSGATADVYGEITASWTTLTTLWGQIAQLSGREILGAEKETVMKSIRVICRYSSEVKPKDRLNINSVYYNITYVRELGRREGLEILADNYE